MSSSDSQPPLTRRQARERERSSATGEQPVVPPATVPAGASAPAASATRSSGTSPRRQAAGPQSATSPAGGALPSGTSAAVASAPTGTPRRRPGSHAAPMAAPPAQAAPVQAAPASAAPAPSGAAVPAPGPATPPPTTDDSVPSSAMEVPGTGMTRRELRAFRAAQLQQQSNPVPLQAPSPQSSDRTVADVLGTVAEIEHDRAVIEEVESAPIDPALLEQATAADGSPDAIEPLADAVAHGEEPRVHRSTWAPAPTHEDDAEPSSATAADIQADEGGTAPGAGTGAATDGSPAAGGPRRSRSQEDPAATTSVATDDAALELATDVPNDPLIAATRSVPSDATPSVFPLDLEGEQRAAAGAVETTTSPANGAERVTDIDTPRAEDTRAADAAADSADRGRTASRRPGRRAGAAPADAEAGAGTDDDSDVAEAGRASRQEGRTPSPVAYEAPVGHWTRQVEEPDDQLHDPETGIIHVTDTRTSSLILPNSALSDVTGALNATGEVIITGSIDLPKTLAATGAHTTNIDGAEVDRLLEQHDGEAPASDATPVRASRAVSSHTSTRAVVLATAKPKDSRLPLILGIGGASVGVVGVAAIVISVFALHLF